MADFEPIYPQNFEDIDQCARCGSSAWSEDCEVCAAFGYYDRPDPQCPGCHGSGINRGCLSSGDWCEAHPLPGREAVPSGQIEWNRVTL